MSIKPFIAMGALLASTSAFAQPPKEQTSDDLVCQLAESCETAQASGDQQQEAIETTPTIPGGRVSATRGFRIATKPVGSASRTRYFVHRDQWLTLPAHT